jgi:hypothetical protein
MHSDEGPQETIECFQRSYCEIIFNSWGKSLLVAKILLVYGDMISRVANEKKY